MPLSFRAFAATVATALPAVAVAGALLRHPQTALSLNSRPRRAASALAATAAKKGAFRNDDGGAKGSKLTGATVPLCVKQ
jgi:hypothetical protein